MLLALPGSIVSPVGLELAELMVQLPTN